MNKIFKASLFRFHFVLFKILQIKNIPSHHFESVHLIMIGPSQKTLNINYKVVSFVINVAYFKHILHMSNFKESLLPLEEKEIRWSKYVTRAKPRNSWQDEKTSVSYPFHNHSLRKLSARF